MAAPSFLSADGYDRGAIMAEAWARAGRQWEAQKFATKRAAFAFYLGQVWCTAQGQFRTRKAIGTTTRIARDSFTGRELATDGRLPRLPMGLSAYSIEE